MKTEIWKDVPEFVGYYQVSNFGRVRRIANYSNQNSSWELTKPKILKCRKHTNGYLRVMFSVNGKHYDRYVHRLVAEVFVENKYGYCEVNHLDGDKTNNNADNLEWCTRSQNNKHAYFTGLRTVKGCYGSLKKKVAQIDYHTNRIVNIYDSIDSAAKELNCNHSSITNCCTKRYKSSYGMKFRYATDTMKVGDVVID